MMNNKQRSRWLSDIISDLQRYVSKSIGQPEAPFVQRALNTIDEARLSLNDKIKADDALDKLSEDQ
jgi:hypothetical protein